MGHIRLRALPGSRKWRQVVALLGEGAGTGAIATATMDAAQSAMGEAAKDPALGHTLWLLAQIPIAAKSNDFPGELRKLGLSVSGQPSLHALMAAFTDAIERKAIQSKRRTDLGEIAQSAASEALFTLIGRESQNLFGETSESVKVALASYATSSNFSKLAHSFTANLTRRYLMYFLSRELANHVGGDRRFGNLSDQREFSKALALHCNQAARIVDEFASGWHGKNRYKGEITERNAAGFMDYALKKIRAELQKKHRP